MPWWRRVGITLLIELMGIVGIFLHEKNRHQNSRWFDPVDGREGLDGVMLTQ